MPTTVRFAPSPTGLLHIGNARTALLNWLYAAARGGRFVLRLDDTDRERSRPEFAAAIREDLAWLGIQPHVEVAQSERLALYGAALEKLKAAGRLYPCFERPDELERRRKRQIARGLPPIYDRAALSLTDADRARLEAEGRRPHWRFLLERRETVFHDLVRGEVRVHADTLSDPVLAREDGSYLYTLPSVVDDIALEITHVIRGEDHVVNTGVQVQIFEALGAAPPVFAHHNLLVSATGEGLSKRTGALSLRSLREAGHEPMAVASLATLIGTSDRVEPAEDLAALAARVDLAHISRAPARFDPADLDALTARVVHRLEFRDVTSRLDALQIGGGEAFWRAVRGNCAKLADAAVWWRVVEGPVEPAEIDPAFLDTARAALPDEPWDESTWERWTEAVRAATGLKGKALFQPLRLALTGLDRGPELKLLLPVIGRARTLARLSPR